MKKKKKSNRKRLLADEKFVNDRTRNVDPLQREESELTEEEIEALIEFADQKAVQGELEHDPGNNADKIRRSKIIWLPKEDFPQVYKKLWRMAQKANKEYRFDITMFIDDIQISYYDEKEEGFFRWHTDMDFSRMLRKLSISVPLNQSSEYEGGELKFNPHGEEVTTYQKKGQGIIFPSFVLHTVTPVTKGRRYSLVAWVGGQPLR
ncbi:2OG-Fe(II) oxygenase [Oceanicoccus sagamiensis]|uniref:Fe2OG dioxygenase domain-containing protein n=1 Tax=Oceanicoccus sagamiensis TaxID=716816 RepID=A0A1X9NDM8_9GAMM|nr:2OG-Fe(II) oxygenase [Oceanicoccus sagamiensis]ARN76140.1 hypothetical protein BST96_19780 [Oceanicoccus sagamiensis]